MHVNNFYSLDIKPAEKALLNYEKLDAYTLVVPVYIDNFIFDYKVRKLHVTTAWRPSLLG